MIAILAVVLAFQFTGGDDNSSDRVTGSTPNESQLIGLQTGDAPWNPGLDHLTDRLKPVGVSALGSEGTVEHIHQHLDIFVNGKHVTVPALIGIYDSQYITELHTHDTSGVMHVEAPTKRNFTLGQFFGVWGVRFTPSCLGAYCNEGNNRLQVFVDGDEVTDNPQDVQLDDQTVIVVTYGTAAELPDPIPSTFDFSSINP